MAKVPDPKIVAKIRKAARDGRIVLAAQDGIHDFPEEVERILRDIGHPEALVTDESSFGDFLLEPKDYKALHASYGFKVQRKDTIATVAKKLAGGKIPPRRFN